MRVLTFFVALLLVASVAGAADSPQFRGLERDGKFADTGLMKTWPAGGPPKAWVATGIGGGYSSASVVGDTIYITGINGDGQGVLNVLDTAGKIQKQVAYGLETDNKQAPGPRSTPTVDGDRLYLLSGVGVVVCFALPDLDIVWKVDTREVFGGKKTAWEIAESVLIDGDNLICTPGGPDASVVALNKTTGATVWTSKGLSDPTSYCSPDIFVHNGNRLLVTETARLVVGLNPDTGKVLWTHEHETDYDIHSVTPVYLDGFLFFSDGYGSGGGLLELPPDGSSVTLKYSQEELDCQHHGLVLHEGYVYATGHQNHKGLLCMELKTGKIAWQTREVTQAVVVFADGMLYTYEGAKRGVVSLVKATPEGFECMGSFEVTDGEKQHWAHPTIANGILYVRHGDALVAYDVKAK